MINGSKVLSRLHLLILPDFAEENWPSMDLCAEMLHVELSRRGDVLAERFAPRYARRFGVWRNADRLLNRFLAYPRQLRATVRNRGAEFDAFHLVDHSYSQLLHELPAERAGVFCHDLDTFRCLIEPRRDPRPGWFRAMAKRILRGLQRAAVVFHSTQSVRQEIERFGLVDSRRLVHAPLGIAPEFVPQAVDPIGPPVVLHVGSCIPRKRVDVLLAVFERLAQNRPDLRLVQVGGVWDAAHLSTVARIGHDRVRQVRGIGRSDLAKLYAGSALVLMPSEAEGFGLPVVEAIACGATVLASDLPVLREVAGEAAVYAPVGEVDAWVSAAGDLLAGRGVPPVQVKRAQAARYSWGAHAQALVATYAGLVGR